MLNNSYLTILVITCLLNINYYRYLSNILYRYFITFLNDISLN